MSTEINPAYRIQTAHTILRCWNPTDAPLLCAAIEASLEHLRPWLPWVKDEPESVAAKAQRLRRMRGEFDLNHDYVYGIFNLDESAVLGGTGLHTRIGDDALEIGYWIHADHVGQGLATEISAALTKVAFEVHKVTRMEIHCDPTNLASASVPRKLGYIHEATLRQRATSGDGSPCDSMIWSLFADGYADSPAARAEIMAYDLLGERLESDFAVNAPKMQI